MKALTLRHGMYAVAAIGIVACSDHDSNSPLRASSRYQGPDYPGGGVAGLAYSIAAGPAAMDCGDPSTFTFSKGPAPTARSQLICFYDTHDAPAATMEWIVEASKEDHELIHARLTLNPDFCDNTYGANSIGWGNRKGPGGMMGPGGAAKAMPGGPAGAMMPGGPGGPGGGAHTFKDLLESDHAEFKITDGNGKLVLRFKEDYISKDSAAPSGYGTLGVSGGDGRMISGDPKMLVAFSTSMDRNFNACGLDSFTSDSPATDSLWTPVAGAEAWDYRVVYDVWIDSAVFGSAGFGKAVVDFVHASPSKDEGGPSSTVEEGPCPPDWKRYCDNPGGCEIEHCGEHPDEFCKENDIPKCDKPGGCEEKRCGDMPDEFCKDGDVPPPPQKTDEPKQPGDAPL